MKGMSMSKSATSAKAQVLTAWEAAADLGLQDERVAVAITENGKRHTGTPGRACMAGSSRTERGYLTLDTLTRFGTLCAQCDWRELLVMRSAGSLHVVEAQREMTALLASTTEVDATTCAMALDTPELTRAQLVVGPARTAQSALAKRVAHGDLVAAGREGVARIVVRHALGGSDALTSLDLSGTCTALDLVIEQGAQELLAKRARWVVELDKALAPEGLLGAVLRGRTLGASRVAVLDTATREALRAWEARNARRTPFVRVEVARLRGVGDEVLETLEVLARTADTSRKTWLKTTLTSAEALALSLIHI